MFIWGVFSNSFSSFTGGDCTCFWGDYFVLPFTPFFPLSADIDCSYWGCGFYSILSLILSLTRLKMDLYLIEILRRPCSNYLKLRPTRYSFGTILSLVRLLNMKTTSFAWTIRGLSSKTFKKYLHVSYMISLLCFFSVRDKWVWLIRKLKTALRFG